MISYLVQLTQRIAPGLLRAPLHRRNELCNYFISALDPGGGFRGRKGIGDLYYSAFALRGLFLLGKLNDNAVLDNVAGFLEKEFQSRKMLPAEIISWMFCAALINLIRGSELSAEQKTVFTDRWESFRRSDGCYAASSQSTISSTYTTFLSALFYELLGEPEKIRRIAIEPILQRQRPDGGFVELHPLRYSGTNPTAAAVGLCTVLETSPPSKQKVADFLAQCQLSDGGFQAHKRIPFPDLLSSFSALTALYDLGAEDIVNRQTLQHFVKSLRSPNGGFSGMPGDKQNDVEYTFYGMILESIIMPA